MTASANPRTPYLIALLIGSLLFGGATYLGNELNLAACPLCILQRMAALVLAIAGLSGLLLPGRFRWPAGLLGLAACFGGAAVATYQVYIQRFATDIQCSGEASWWELFVDWAGQQAPLFFQANGLCSDPAWKLLGLSLAEYSLLVFLVLGISGVHAWIKRR